MLKDVMVGATASVSMNLTRHYLLHAFSFRGRCPRLAYWWRTVVLLLAFWQFSAMLLICCASISDNCLGAAGLFILVLALVHFPPLSLLSIWLSWSMALAIMLGEALRGPIPPQPWEELSNGLWLAASAMGLLLVTARGLALSVRRLRDAGHDPVYYLFCTIPLLGWFMATIMLSQRSLPASQQPSTSPSPTA